MNIFLSPLCLFSSLVFFCSARHVCSKSTIYYIWIWLSLCGYIFSGFSFVVFLACLIHKINSISLIWLRSRCEIKKKRSDTHTPARWMRKKDSRTKRQTNRQKKEYLAKSRKKMSINSIKRGYFLKKLANKGTAMNEQRFICYS